MITVISMIINNNKVASVRYQDDPDPSSSEWSVRYFRLIHERVLLSKGRPVSLSISP